jgi:hypothetical protein
MVDDLNSRIPLEDKLRHIVPPAVRVMQEELKTQLSEILSQQYEVEAKTEAEERTFLQQRGLPQALHAVTSTTELPADLWSKIEEF